jgi:squalene-hopene/tetraprenyl-beta-curcumene cyclase
MSALISQPDLTADPFTGRATAPPATDTAQNVGGAAATRATDPAQIAYGADAAPATDTAQTAAASPSSAAPSGLAATAAAAAARQLLASRTSEGHWEGELSSSALSTATAIFALKLAMMNGIVPQAVAGPLIDSGARWLIDHQNIDGGWGDTIRSFSNISTTALCWAALADDAASERVATAADMAKAPAANRASAAVLRCEKWLCDAAGSLAPDDIAAAIIARYGKDRTFSVPILTMCALAGRLGDGRAAWRHIPQLPFELAACPHQWFTRIKMPVVSYALPALISMGHARHRWRPTRNPIARLIRRLTASRTLDVLLRIAPVNGGFLEATPLTSFVAMSMIGAGHADHEVVRRGLGFLIASVRADGSWPIDTNLSTWLTTLAVNALSVNPMSVNPVSVTPPLGNAPSGSAPSGRHEQRLDESQRRRICDWLLSQQYRVEHPYTHAAPGGWAWTHLPGGVPDADDTAGALIALWNLRLRDANVLRAAADGARWLLDLQNADGGIPTFCRGWGHLPFDRSGADLTAHALQAWSLWKDSLCDSLACRIERATRRALGYLADQQRPDGAWLPLWFGSQHVEDEHNPTYGTARVLAALANLRPDFESGFAPMRARASQWLLRAQNPDGSWGGGPGAAGSIEETSLALTALAAEHSSARAANQSSAAAPSARSVATDPSSPAASAAPPIAQAVERAVAWLAPRAMDPHPAPAPIGFYFAKLWYFERLYPPIFAAAALSAAAT